MYIMSRCHWYRYSNSYWCQQHRCIVCLTGVIDNGEAPKIAKISTSFRNNYKFVFSLQSEPRKDLIHEKKYIVKNHPPFMWSVVPENTFICICRCYDAAYRGCTWVRKKLKNNVVNLLRWHDTASVINWKYRYSHSVALENKRLPTRPTGLLIQYIMCKVYCIQCEPTLLSPYL